jgi:hypothetical protein
MLASRRLARELKLAQIGFRPDVVMGIKTIYFRQELLLDIPASRHIHLSFDDVSNQDNISKQYLESESTWDLIVTTKRHNCPEIAARGGTPLFVWAAYDPRYHASVTPYASRKYNAGFIGAARPDREWLPRRFAHDFAGEAVVVGPRWDRQYPKGYPGVTMRGPAMGNAYREIANQIQIGLVLLNSENRDQHTNRSIETPLAGQLVLAEDTPEHRELFIDGESGVLFRDVDHALSLMNELAGNPSRAAEIARLGTRLIREGSFEYADRAREILEFVS